jgi:hypothetical protein
LLALAMPPLPDVTESEVVVPHGVVSVTVSDVEEIPNVKEDAAFFVNVLLPGCKATPAKLQVLPDAALPLSSIFQPLLASSRHSMTLPKSVIVSGFLPLID